MPDLVTLLNGKLEVQETSSHRYVPLATEQVVTSFEQATGLTLPSSYKQWCMVFGAGELAGFFRIASPMKSASEFELRQYHSTRLGSPEDDLWSSQIERDFLSGMYWFAGTIGGESFAWQTKEVTDEAAHEYRIYYIPRYGPPEACADSFSDWVINRCLTPNRHRKWSPEWCFGRFELS